MNYVYKALLTMIAAAVLIGSVGCTTMKHEPAPAAPAPKADRL